MRLFPMCLLTPFKYVSSSNMLTIEYMSRCSRDFQTFSSFSNCIPQMCETKKYVFTGNSRAETWRLQFSRDLTLRLVLVIFAHRNFTETVNVKLLCFTTTCLLYYRMMHWNRDSAIHSQNFGKISTYKTPFHFDIKNSISNGVDLKLYDKFTLTLKSLT